MPAGKRCDAHEDMADRVTRIETNTNQILTNLSRLEERMYQDHGAISQTTGRVTERIKVAGIAAAVGAAMATAIKLMVG